MSPPIITLGVNDHSILISGCDSHRMPCCSHTYYEKDHDVTFLVVKIIYTCAPWCVLKPSLPQVHFPTCSTCCFPATMVNFCDPAVIACNSCEYTFKNLALQPRDLRKTTNLLSAAMVKLWHIVGSLYMWAIGLFSSQHGLYLNSPQVGNTSPLLNMNGMSLGGVSLTSGRYGFVHIFASFWFSLPH